MKTGMLGLAAVAVVMASRIASAGPIAVSVDTNPIQCVAGNCSTQPITSVTLHDDMRVLWVEHNVWSRMVLMGVFESMKGCEFYEDRVVLNVKTMQAMLVPYYGDGAIKFGLLLEQHLKIEDEILYGMKTGDMTFRSIIPDWYKNAEEISDLLYGLNPKVWNRDEMNQMWRMHLDASLDQAFAYQKGDWQSEIKSFDFIQYHSTRMADYLSDGIRKQFPKN